MTRDDLKHVIRAQITAAVNVTGNLGTGATPAVNRAVDMILAAADAYADQVVCRHCQQPIQRCDDTYPGHHCRGWRHSDGFHRCDPRHAEGDVHAEPGQPAITSGRQS